MVRSILRTARPVSPQIRERSRRRASVDAVILERMIADFQHRGLPNMPSVAMRWLASAGTALGSWIPRRSALRIRLPPSLQKRRGRIAVRRASSDSAEHTASPSA
jgi:hypothetical protein